MKKIWLLKVLGICLCICVSIFLFTTHSNGQFGYQQSYNPYGPYQILEDPYGYNPYLEDDYRPPPDFSNWNWTDPWTAYDPSGGGAVAVNWQPEYIGTSPYFRQTGYNPYNFNVPYNYGWNQPSYGWSQPSYGWNQPSYGWNMPYINVWNQPYTSGWNSPFNPGWNQPYIYTQNPYTPTSTSTSNIGNEEYLVYSAMIDEDDRISNKTLVWNLPSASYYSTLLDSIEGLERETIDDFMGKNTKQYTLKDNFSFNGDYELVSDGSGDKHFSRVGFNSDKDQALVHTKAGFYGNMLFIFLIKEDGVWKAVDSYVTAYGM